jgi:uncharacterized membrane protein YphA (DoxX/SURF4 family)
MPWVDMISIAARLVIAGTLFLAAFSKLRDRAGFARGVHDYGLLSPASEMIVIRLLPAVEVALGICLLLGLAEPWPALAAAGLFALFAAAIAVTAGRGRDIPCHCFGTSSKHRVGAGSLLRTFVLALLALVAAFAPAANDGMSGPLALWTSEEVMALISITAWMTLAVVLAEPMLLLASGVRAARRRAPALKAAEASRRTHTCGAAGTQAPVELMS